MVVVVLVEVGGLAVVVVDVLVVVVVLVLVGGLMIVVVDVLVVVVVLVEVGGLAVGGGPIEEPAADVGLDEDAPLSDEGWDIVLDGEFADEGNSDVLLSDDWLPRPLGIDDVLLSTDASESELPPLQAAAAKATDNATARSFICTLLCTMRVLIILS